MDLTPAISQFWSNFLFLVPAVVIISLLKTARFKGIVGETLVNTSAKVFLNKKDYHLIKNVTLPTREGTTQIDQIILSKYGVFVIETKNMSGWIFGSPEQKTWPQKIYRQTNKFQNPLHQNYKHVKTLQSLLGIADHQIHSLIVFVGDSKFKTKMPKNVTSGGGYCGSLSPKKKPLSLMNKLMKS